MNRILFGVDYGSKLTGNTVLCIFLEGQILFMDVEKGVDADLFIYNAADHFKPSHIFIDAPLSLPGIYCKMKGFDNFHFRKADLEVNAMSPMFLGGLVARAMELKVKLEHLNIEVLETFPKVLANRFKLKDLGYKGSRVNLAACIDAVVDRLSDAFEVDKESISSWHHLDSLLTLLTAINYIHGKADKFGDKKEGLIYV